MIYQFLWQDDTGRCELSKDPEKQVRKTSFKLLWHSLSRAQQQPDSVWSCQTDDVTRSTVGSQMRNERVLEQKAVRVFVHLKRGVIVLMHGFIALGWRGRGFLCASDCCALSNGLMYNCSTDSLEAWWIHLTKRAKGHVHDPLSQS